MIETIACPECGKVAATQWYAVLESTDGPIEHAEITHVSPRRASV